MKYLLDTNICIYLIKQKPHSVLEKFKTLQVGDVGISSVTLAELSYGVEKSQYVEKNKSALENFLLPLELMSFDKEATDFYGKIRVFLEKKGATIGPLDYMIAAHALSLDVTLVTNNTKEFLHVPHLKLENWV
ncbi:MAG: type II toxin-antitoxin system VapC family toxin [Pseudomonadota bacterium]